MLPSLAVTALLLCSTVSTAAAAADPTPPTLTEACGTAAGDLSARSLWVETNDGVRLYMIQAGSGTTAVVLAHGGGSDLCETLEFATQLVAAGYRVVAFDFRGGGRSETPSRNTLALGNDLAAAVVHARRTGTEHVFLVGSSMGGAAIVQNTSALRVDGRVSLSGTRLWPGFGINNPPGVARIHDPFLYLGTRDDPRAPLKEALGIFRKVGAADKRTAFYPGSDHGWAIIEHSQLAAQARALVLRWIAGHA